MYKRYLLLTLVFILFAMATHAASRTPGGSAPEGDEPDEGGGPPVGQAPSGAPLRTTPLVYVLGLLGGVVWFHLSEALL